MSPVRDRSKLVMNNDRSNKIRVGGGTEEAPADKIFEPLKLSNNLVIKNRLLRSNVSGMFDHYNGQGSRARIKWETSFARGGVGCIISSFTPVAVRGRILVRYAMIDNDDKIPFWTEIGRRVREAGREAFPDDPAQSGDCHFIMQLSHSGRQQDMGGVENVRHKALSSTSKNDYFHGILCRSMTGKEVRQVVQQFADAAERAQKAGLSGVELHGANGYLFTQFLSSAINDRTDEYGGSLKNRSRFLLEVIDAIRQRVGGDFHLQLKTNAEDYDNALYPWMKRGNRLDDAVSICNWAVDAGVDALHISSGSIFPHPRNPPGDFPLADAVHWYDGMLSSGVNTRFNYWVFKHPIVGPLFRWWWNKRRGIPYQDIQNGVNLDFAARIKRELIRPVPVIVTGGFQHAQIIRSAIQNGLVDAVSIARPLIANRDLPKLFHKGMDWDDRFVPDEDWPLENRHPCSYCNKCLLNDLENPLACYDDRRFSSHEEMIEKAMEVFPKWDEYRNDQEYGANGA